MAHYARKPWGFDADDIRMGLLTATVWQAAGAKEAVPADFMLSTVLEKAGDDDEDPLDKFDRAVPSK